jgi:hypothetical protein
MACFRYASLILEPFGKELRACLKTSTVNKGWINVQYLLSVFASDPFREENKLESSMFFVAVNSRPCQGQGNCG